MENIKKEREAINKLISNCRKPQAAFTDGLTDTITGQDAITDLIISSYGQMASQTILSLTATTALHELLAFFNYYKIII